MRRWNGWGDTATDYELTDNARTFLNERVGESQALQDTPLEDCIGQVPVSRLQGQDGLDCDEQARLLRAHGESFPDWLAKKNGRFGPFPDAVVRPESEEEVAALLAQAQQAGWQLIPFAGGTSVVGHLSVPAEAPPVVSVDLSGLNRLTHLDETSRLATFEAGTPGPLVEQQLKAHGYRLGHFPQSWEYSTVGGWVVTRSSGQQSLAYGRIEQLFAGGRLATPRGELHIPTLPASSAGPDLREFVMGSEGRFGILSSAQMRVSPLPEAERFEPVMFPDWTSAIDAVRSLAQAKPGLSMVRLSNAVETETQLALAGHETAIAALQRYLRLRGIAEGQCMLMVGVSGTGKAVRRIWGDAMAICKPFGGVHMGPWVGRAWEKNRFRGPYLRNSLWAAGYAADTVETAVDWPRVTEAMQAMEQAARDAFAEDGEKVHAFTHLSHVYPQGCSIYSTFVFRATADHEQMLARWQRFKARLSQTVVEYGGTISHQHGVGTDHKAYLPAEKSALGIDMLRAVARELDPQGIMNTGKLFD
ncbi:MAG: FAD-binding oxidoreductase [Oceanococcus sp.]